MAEPVFVRGFYKGRHWVLDAAEAIERAVQQVHDSLTGEFKDPHRMRRVYVAIGSDNHYCLTIVVPARGDDETYHDRVGTVLMNERPGMLVTGETVSSIGFDRSTPFADFYITPAPPAAKGSADGS